MNIRVDSIKPIIDGMDLIFRTPVDCSQVTGLIVYYNGESKEFAFADAHGNNVGDIDHLFAENVVVKVILDVTTGMAFVQNADTNAYLEGRFKELEELIGTGGGGSTECTVKYINSTDANLTILKNLDSGSYIIEGTFKFSSSNTEKVAITEKRFALVSKKATYTAVRIFNSTGTDTIYKIEDTRYTVWYVSNLKMMTTDNLVTTIDETSDDEHYPTAKAVYEAIDEAIGGTDSPVIEPVDYSVYFDIDYDGKISLKPEYRGDSVYGASNQYPFSISDNGSGVEGSKINELPEIIVIPKNVDGQEVTGFQNGIFCCNKRVKEITIPETIKKISAGFTREAIYFEKLINTEQIVEIGAGAFQLTRIREMICPQLTSLPKGNVFANASCLIRVNLGTITAIPKSTFMYCENLTEVVADKVTSIGDSAFYATRRLKSLPFIANVTSIASAAFWSSRCDLELLPDSCTFGAQASYKQFNSTDYWTGVAFTPCKNQLGSLFHQKDPRWVDKEIKYTDKTGKTWEYKDANGNALTYGGNGCAFITLAEIYSAFKGVKFESPEDFLPVLEEAGALGIDFRNDRNNWCQIANKLGFETEYLTSMTATNLKKLYDALASGALLYKSVAGKVGEETSADGGHATLAYGINTNGEMLCSDSSMHCYDVGIYENHLNAWHIYKHGSLECDCVIVRKPTA